ncbi:MAG: hypothetical protein LBG84_02765 [Treponema sp.]|jgi:hypothetical protein|nr:hypothetical protein [Treponema sp.]
MNGTNLEKRDPRAEKAQVKRWLYRHPWRVTMVTAIVGLVALAASCLIPLDGDSPASDDTVQYDAQGRRLLVIKTSTGGGGGVAVPPGL